jgi:hypothetical protein
MKANELTDLLGKECVLIESGQGMIVRCLNFYDDEIRLYADVEMSHPTIFGMNRIRLNGEPVIADWDGNSESVGESFNIFQPQNQVFRSPKSYLHFSSPLGGTRLLFLSEYIEKVRSRDAEGWEWDDIMRKASEVDEYLEDSGAAEAIERTSHSKER